MCAQKTLAATMSTLFVPVMSVIESGDRDRRTLKILGGKCCGHCKECQYSRKSDPSARAISSVSGKDE
jgi:hypothetical protein